MIATNTNLRREFADLLREIIIPEIDDEKGKLEKYSRINNCITPNLPKSLFRYRTLAPHGIEAFQKGVISVTKPCKMGDVLDSLITVDTERVIEGIKNMSSDENVNNIADFFIKGGEIPSYPLSFCSRSMRRFIKNGQKRVKGNPKFRAAIKKSVQFSEKELIEITEKKQKQLNEILRKTGYIACFCERGDNYKMWSDYAEGHKGYALEYDFETLNSRFHTFDKDGEQFQPINITLPVIYGEQYESTGVVIGSVANDLLKGAIGGDFFFKQQDELWYIKGYSYKHEDYEPEAEWRLITPIRGVSANSEPYSSIKGEPKAIYYGAKMPEEKIEELDAIAKEKRIKRYKMDIKTSHIIAVPL